MNENFIENDFDKTQNEVGTTDRDVFVVGGPASDYGFQATSDGGIVVWNLVTRTHDFLYNVEALQFEDASFDFVDGSFVISNAESSISDGTIGDTGDDPAEVIQEPIPEAVLADFLGYESGTFNSEPAEAAAPSDGGSTGETSAPASGTTTSSFDHYDDEIFGGTGDDFPPPSGDDFPPVDDDCEPGKDHDVIHLSDKDKDVKAEFELKIKKGDLGFKLELKAKDGALAGLGDDVEFVSIDTSHLEAAMTEAGVENVSIGKLEVKDNKIELEIDGYFRLSKEEAEDLDWYLPNAIDLPVTVLVDGKHVEVCLSIKPDFDAHSPIALDMNGDGEIGVTGETSSFEKDSDAELGKTVEFDIDADGKLDTIEWFDGSGDGILVDLSKIKSDGSIDGSALFGDEGGKFANGYEKLQSHDADGDGSLKGAELDGLGMWMDDGDAVLEEGELKTVSDAGVTEISTTMNLVEGDDGKSLMQSFANLADGTTIMSEDVWFDTASVEAMKAELEDFSMDHFDDSDVELA